MAEIKVAESAGFCFGVDRAVKLVYGELEMAIKVLQRSDLLFIMQMW